MRSKKKQDIHPKEKELEAISIRCEKNNYLGVAIKELRIEKGLTQDAAADLAGITLSMWHAYESGRTRAPLETVIEIAKAFEVSPFALVARALDKSKYFDPVYELTIQDYQNLEENEIKNYRKRKLSEKLEALC
jgi:transcriptional regulator with XRE-family HTH domain